MGISQQHTLYGVEIGKATPVVLGGITRVNQALNTIIHSEARSGEEFARLQAILGQDPRATFATNAIAAALDECALAGLDISTLSTGLNFYAQKKAHGGSRASGAVHRKYTVNDGILVPTRLSCEHRGNAELEYDTVITWDGTNDPFVITDSSALPSGLDDTERFTLGPVMIESVTINQKRSFQIDFRIEPVPEGADSDIWPTHVSIKTTLPMLRIRVTDVEVFKAAAIPITGKSATHTNTAIYLRKRASGGTFVADATAEHIKLTAAGLATVEEVFNAQGQETGELELQMPLKYDGTNDPLTINTASALP